MVWSRKREMRVLGVLKLAASLALARESGKREAKVLAVLALAARECWKTELGLLAVLALAAREGRMREADVRWR